MKPLSQQKIDEIVDKSEDAYECLLNFYKEAIAPIEWEQIETLKPWGVKVCSKTAQYMLEQMHAKYTGHDGDPWIVNSIMLNKGFSANGDDVPEWHVKIEKDTYSLKA